MPIPIRVPDPCANRHLFLPDQDRLLARESLRKRTRSYSYSYSFSGNIRPSSVR